MKNYRHIFLVTALICVISLGSASISPTAVEAGQENLSSNDPLFTLNGIGKSGVPVFYQLSSGNATVEWKNISGSGSDQVSISNFLPVDINQDGVLKGNELNLSSSADIEINHVNPSKGLVELNDTLPSGKYANFSAKVYENVENVSITQKTGYLNGSVVDPIVSESFENKTLSAGYWNNTSRTYEISNIFLDTKAPSISNRSSSPEIISGVANLTGLFEYGSLDGGDLKFKVKYDGTSLETLNSSEARSFDTTDLAPVIGTYNIEAVVEDAVENQNSSESSVYVDNSGPQSSESLINETYFNYTNPVMRIEIGDPISGLNYSQTKVSVSNSSGELFSLSLDSSGSLYNDSGTGVVLNLGPEKGSNYELDEGIYELRVSSEDKSKNKANFSSNFIVDKTINEPSGARTGISNTLRKHITQEDLNKVNGKSDLIQVPFISPRTVLLNFSEISGIDPTNLKASDFVVQRNASNEESYIVRDASLMSEKSYSDLVSEGLDTDSLVILELNQAIPSDAELNVTILNNSKIRDKSGNRLIKSGENISIKAIDGQGPRVISAASYDRNKDGTTETIVLNLSEKVNTVNSTDISYKISQRTKESFELEPSLAETSETELPVSESCNRGSPESRSLRKAKFAERNVNYWYSDSNGSRIEIRLEGQGTTDCINMMPEMIYDFENGENISRSDVWLPLRDSKGNKLTLGSSTLYGEVNVFSPRDKASPVLLNAFVHSNLSNGDNTYVRLNFSEQFIRTSSIISEIGPEQPISRAIVNGEALPVSQKAGLLTRLPEMNWGNDPFRMDNIIMNYTGVIRDAEGKYIENLTAVSDYEEPNNSAIVPEPVEISTYKKRLDEGWNYISFPIAGAQSVPIDSIEGTDKIESVWTYNSAKGKWQNSVTDFSTLKGGKGYLFKAKESFMFDPSLPTSNPQNLSSIEIHEGWNLIGHMQEYNQPMVTFPNGFAESEGPFLPKFVPKGPYPPEGPMWLSGAFSGFTNPPDIQPDSRECIECISNPLIDYISAIKKGGPFADPIEQVFKHEEGLSLSGNDPFEGKDMIVKPGSAHWVFVSKDLSDGKKQFYASERDSPIVFEKTSTSQPLPTKE